MPAEQLPEPYRLPDTGFLRSFQITGCKRRNVPPIIPIARSTWWRLVAEGGVYPPGILLSTRTRVWTVESIRKLIADLAATEAVSR